MNQQANNQLRKFLEQHRAKPTPSERQAPATKLAKKNTRHSLHDYCAVVEFPVERGGGVTWYKNRAAVQALETKSGYRVVWL